MWPPPVAPRSSRRTAWLWVVLALLRGCSPSADAVSADAREVVERILAADPIRQWRFTYRGDNPSPYSACLQGEDVIVGTVDLDARLLWLQPVRRAPVVLVTDTEVLVPDLAGDDTWASVVWQADERTAATTNQFGNVLGRYVANGLGVAERAHDVDRRHRTVGALVPRGRRRRRRAARHRAAPDRVAVGGRHRDGGRHRPRRGTRSTPKSDRADVRNDRGLATHPPAGDTTTESEMLGAGR